MLKKLLSTAFAVITIAVVSVISASAAASKGDVDNSGAIDVKDATLVLNHINGVKSLSSSAMKAADIDSNGNVDIQDVSAIMNHINGVSPIGISAYEREVVELVNKERAKNGVAPLKLNEDLCEVARTRCKDMIEYDYFSHTSPVNGSFSNFIIDAGIRFSTAGENIAAGQRTPEEVVSDWMTSDGHRANILSPSYKEIGVGFASGGYYRYYWTQLFIG